MKTKRRDFSWTDNWKCIRAADTTRIIIIRTIITHIIIIRTIITRITIIRIIITTITTRTIHMAITTVNIKVILQSPEFRTLFYEASCYVRSKLF